MVSDLVDEYRKVYVRMEEKNDYIRWLFLDLPYSTEFYKDPKRRRASSLMTYSVRILSFQEVLILS